VRKKSCYFYIPLSITSHEYNKNITWIERRFTF
jgi:hypothetical protein